MLGIFYLISTTCSNIPPHDSHELDLVPLAFFLVYILPLICLPRPFCMGPLSHKPSKLKPTNHLHTLSTLPRRIKSFLLLYQRNQRAGLPAASGPTVQGTRPPEVAELDPVGWPCLALADIPYPSGRSPSTSGTVRGQRPGGGCCRQSVPPLSGRTRPRRVPTASRSTSQKRKLDSEHTHKGLQGVQRIFHTPAHPSLHHTTGSELLADPAFERSNLLLH